MWIAFHERVLQSIIYPLCNDRDFSFNFPFLHSPNGLCRSCCCISLACVDPVPQLPDHTRVFISTSEEGLELQEEPPAKQPHRDCHSQRALSATSVTVQHQPGVPGRGTARAAAAQTQLTFRSRSLAGSQALPPTRPQAPPWGSHSPWASAAVVLCCQDSRGGSIPCPGWSPSPRAAIQPHTPLRLHSPRPTQTQSSTFTTTYKSARKNNLAGVELGFYSSVHFSRDSRKKKQLRFWDSTSSKTKGGKSFHKSKIKRIREVWNIKS